MTIAIFYDAEGRITYSGELESMTEDDIDEQLEVAVDYLESEDYPDGDTQWVDDGEIADRPTIESAAQWVIAADGVDSVYFEAPEGTAILVNPANDDRLLEEGEMPADGLFVLRSNINGEFVIAVLPPFPYQHAHIGVTASGEVDTPASPPGSPSTELEITLDMPVIEGLTGEARPRFNYWSWEESLNPRHSHYELTFYTTEDDADNDTNGNLVGPIVEAFYQDREDTDIDDGLWARVTDVDVDGNRSEKSDWATVTARGVQTGDVEPKAITASKIYSFGGSNLQVDFEMAELELWSATEQTPPAGTETALTGSNFVRSLNPTADGRGFSDYKFRVTTTAVNKNLYFNCPASIVDEGVIYDHIVQLENINAQSISYVNYFAEFYRMNSSGALEYVSQVTNVYPDFNGIFTLAQNAKIPLLARFVTPLGVTHVRMRIQVGFHASAIRDVYISSARLKLVVQSVGDVTRFARDHQGGALTGTFGTGDKLLLSASLGPFVTRPMYVELHGCIRNRSGATGTYTFSFRFREGGTGSWTTAFSITCILRDDEIFEKTVLFTKTEINTDPLSPGPLNSSNDIMGDYGNYIQNVSYQYGLWVIAASGGNDFGLYDFHVKATFA